MFSNLMHHFCQFLSFKELFCQCLFKTPIDLLVYCLFIFPNSFFFNFFFWLVLIISNKKIQSFFLMLAIEVNYVIYAFLLSVATTLVNKICIVCTPHWFEIHAIAQKREVAGRITTELVLGNLWSVSRMLVRTKDQTTLLCLSNAESPWD